MKIQSIHPLRSRCAMTMLEFFVVVIVLAVLAGIFLPALYRPKTPATRIPCVNNLKNVGLAFRIFATDHTNSFPTAISTNLGGTMEFATAADVWRHFLALSNELSVPQLVYCPSDKQRRKATSWQSFGNQNVSYFVSLDATENDPNAWLAGDRNLESNGQPLGPAAVTLTTNVPIVWGKNMHNMQGNILQGDGSVQQMFGDRLLRGAGLATNRLLIP